MKEGFDREIDLLLRRRARGTAESRPWGDGAPGAHLDADELSAFVEGALPAAARLAAASHLADCARCRGVVVGLAPAVGTGAEVKHQAAVAPGPLESARPSAWRAFVASIFAPRVMRFAVPVLALSLVGVVSYVALRSDRSGALQAAREGRSPNVTMQSAPSAQANTNTAGDTNTGLLAAQNSNAPREAPVVVAPAQEKGHGGAEARPAEVDADNKDAQPPAESSAAPPPAAPVTVTSEGPAELSKAAPKPVTSSEEGEAARADNKEKAESRDKSARGSEPADDAAASNDASMQQRNIAQRSMNQMPDGGTPRNSQKRAADNNSSAGYSGGGAPAKESERAGSRSEAAGRARESRQAEKKADEDATYRGGDTLNTAGHRFRREGSAWVDVNYKSSMPSTGVRRGTESFRALVADVPEVGRVAQAVGGEVIVVVKGRAYRIR